MLPAAIIWEDHSLRTFTLNLRSSTYAARLCTAIQENYGYISYFNRGDTPEAVQRIFYQALKAEKPYDDLAPYVKKLARNVMKTRTKETPYATYNEDGEVSVAFVGLVAEDTYNIGDKEHITALLDELYLSYPEDFMKLKELIPTVEQDGDVKPAVIKNPKLRDGIFRLMREFSGTAVFYTLLSFIKELEAEKRVVPAVQEYKMLNLIPMDINKKAWITDKKWVCDADGRQYGINPATMTMDDDYNVEFSKFRLAIPTSCGIWRMDCSEYYSDIENYIYAEQGADNKYILWCHNKYRLITPAGTPYIGMSREVFMDKVRQELLLSVVASGFGTVIAVSPDNIYIKMTRATACKEIRMKAASGTIYTFPLYVQSVERSR